MRLVYDGHQTPIFLGGWRARLVIWLKVVSCGKCQKNNKKMKKPSGPLHPIPVQPQLWHQIGMDLIGPLTEIEQY